MSYLMIVAGRNETQQSNLISSINLSPFGCVHDRNELPEDSLELHLIVYTQEDSVSLHIEYIRKLWISFQAFKSVHEFRFAKREDKIHGIIHSYALLTIN
jgi:hypothetical protein